MTWKTDFGTQNKILCQFYSINWKKFIEFLGCKILRYFFCFSWRNDKIDLLLVVANGSRKNNWIVSSWCIHIRILWKFIIVNVICRAIDLLDFMFINHFDYDIHHSGFFFLHIRIWLRIFMIIILRVVILSFSLWNAIFQTTNKK